MDVYPVIDLPDTLYKLTAEDYPDDTAEAPTLHLLGVLEQIADERWLADQRYGGPANDDANTPDDWDLLICRIAMGAAAVRNDLGAQSEYRQKLVELAQVTVAAIQAWDRRHAVQVSAPALADGDA